MGEATQIQRDFAYGPDERHRLDLFRQGKTDKAPVLVFVHGGGFVMGDKRSAGTPFYDNIGDFAARSGMVGVTITYRLAPANQWPAGPEDLSRLIAWLRENIADHGGDPERIFLIGQSAGAVHVAGYVAHKRFHQPDGPAIAGALMISCIFDVATSHVNQFHQAYYGTDESAYAACSTTQGLIESDVPWLCSVSEFDAIDFHKQAAAFVAAYTAVHARYPRMLYLAGHNHLSPVLSIGSPDSQLEREIIDFIVAVSV
jgi:triacylglycerol lipase